MRWLRVVLAALLLGCTDAAAPASDPPPPRYDDQCPPDAARLCVPAEPCVLSICDPDETCLTYRPPVRITACIPCGDRYPCGEGEDHEPTDLAHEAGRGF